MSERRQRARKIAFCFPGQGSLEAGMGREIAEAVPEAMAVFERGERGLRARPRAALLRRRRSRSWSRPRCSSRRSSRRASRCSPRCARAGIEPDFVVGHSVGEFAALARRAVAGRPRRRSRSSASAGSRWPRRPSSTPARWRRSSGSTTRSSRSSAARSSACGRRTTTAPARSSSRARRRRSTSAARRPRSAGARRAVKLRVSGAFHSPLVARAAERLRPAIERVQFNEPVAPFMSTVTAKIEPAQRLGTLLVEQLTAPVRFTQAAARADRGGRRRRSSRSGRATSSPV